MATLEKIRRRSVLLIIVIAVALLAFIVGDALTNSRNIFGDRTTVAKVGNQKIDYTDYQSKREQLNSQIEMQKRQNPSYNMDMQLLPQIAINQLIGEALLDNAVKKAGIDASGGQLSFYMLENPVSENLPVLINQMKAQGLDVESPRQAYEVIFNPKRYGLTEAQVAPYRNLWLSIEEETKALVKRRTYQRLLLGTVQANELDKKAMHNDYVQGVDFKYAYKSFGAIDEKKYPVSDAELRDRYEKDKVRYKAEEETKSVSLIAVSVAPSAADRKAGAALATKVMASLSDSLGSVSKDEKKAGVQVTRKVLRSKDIPAGKLKEFLQGAGVGTSSLIRDDMSGFLAVKLDKKSSEVDSIQLNLVQVAGKVLPGKVVAALNAGLSIDSIQTKFPADSVAGQKEQWIPMFTNTGRTNALEASQLDSLNNAGGRYVVLMQEDQGAVIAQVVKRTSPVEVYEYDEIEYALKPSTATVNEARTKLEKFLASNKDAASFNKNAQKAGYNINKYDFTQSSPAVPVMEGANSFFPDSRQIVRWVMIDGEKGDVSHIYESKDALRPMLYAVAVDDVFEDYYPLNHRNVKAELTDKIRREKVGEAMVKQYSAKGDKAETIASAMGEPLQTGRQKMAMATSGVSDADVAGYIMGMKPGKKAKVMKGNNGVYVIEVTGASADKVPYDDQTYASRYYQMLRLQNAQNWINSVLKGNRKVKNNAYKFEAGD